MDEGFWCCCGAGDAGKGMKGAGGAEDGMWAGARGFGRSRESSAGYLGAIGMLSVVSV